MMQYGVRKRVKYSISQDSFQITSEYQNSKHEIVASTQTIEV